VNYFDNRYFAEMYATMILVFVGCSAAVIGGGNVLQIALAFGLTLTAIAYWLEGSSGGHANPAISIAMWSAGRMSTRDMIAYVVYQMIGGVIGAALVLLIVSIKGGTIGPIPANLGQNGYEAGMFGGFSLMSALFTEFLATLLFALVVLSVTRNRLAIGGLVIGLTLVALHMAFFNVDGLSVNPARSFGPAVFVGGKAMVQLWLFLLIPALAGAIAGLLSKDKVI
jgi:aquaporin Z